MNEHGMELGMLAIFLIAGIVLLVILAGADLLLADLSPDELSTMGLQRPR
jgi:hypothetical protein